MHRNAREGGAAVIAITYFKLYVAGEVLTASDLNSSLSYITTNALTMISPLTGNLDVDGNVLIMDSNADSTLSAVVDDILKIQLKSVAAFYFDGSVAGVTNGMTLTATATGVAPSIAAQGGDATIGLTLTPKGATSTVYTNGSQRLLLGADVASANALLANIAGNSFDITGTTSITSITTKGVGTFITLQFDGALTLTHHATNLILPGAANITTAAGDIAVFWEYGAGTWRCVSYQRAATTPDAANSIYVGRVNAISATPIVLAASGLSALCNRWVIDIVGLSSDGTANWTVQVGDSTAGFFTSGYLGSGAEITNGAFPSVANYTTGFGIKVAAAAALVRGTITLTRAPNAGGGDFDTWLCSGELSRSDAAISYLVSGSLPLTSAATPPTLDRIRINTTDAFDAGVVHLRGYR